MCKSTIRKMFYGESGNCELIKPTEEYNKLLSMLVKYDNDFRLRLADMPELLELYEKINDISIDTTSESCATHYVEAFKFGLLMGMEIAGSC